MNPFDIDKVDFKQAFNRLDSYFFIKDVEGCYVFVNDAICKLFGLDNEQILGKHDHDFFDLDECNDIAYNDQRVLAGQTISKIEQSVLKGQRTRFYQVMKSPLLDVEGKVIGVFGIAIDVTGTVEKRNELETMVIRDVLTGLYNRRFFEMQLIREHAAFQRHKQPLSLLMLDIDNFKSINDQFGHSMGDHVLEGLGRLMLEALRIEDYCCRYGGDEFAILLPNTRLQEAYFLAERLRARVADKRFDTGSDEKLVVSISLGCANLTSMQDIKMMTNFADVALMQAKRNQKNITYVSCELKQAILTCSDCSGCD
ncbi:diguanylate cyclase [Vibrio sp. 10N.261.51.F12]|uniref:sensor domain-containing diguanylate cyclase n=1 Tax=Vibrio sp. 10N.261.51.F12 TaxID=3229679 RepID=UPI00354D6EEB